MTHTHTMGIPYVHNTHYQMIICFGWHKAVEQFSKWHRICFIIDSVSAKTI